MGQSRLLRGGEKVRLRGWYLYIWWFQTIIQMIDQRVHSSTLRLTSSSRFESLLLHFSKLVIFFFWGGGWDVVLSHAREASLNPFACKASPRLMDRHAEWEEVKSKIKALKAKVKRMIRSEGQTILHHIHHFPSSTRVVRLNVLGSSWQKNPRMWFKILRERTLLPVMMMKNGVLFSVSLHTLRDPSSSRLALRLEIFETPLKKSDSWMRVCVGWRVKDLERHHFTHIPNENRVKVLDLNWRILYIDSSWI